MVLSFSRGSFILAMLLSRTFLKSSVDWPAMALSRLSERADYISSILEAAAEIVPRIPMERLNGPATDGSTEEGSFR
jgi:hypothetical protein